MFGVRLRECRTLRRLCLGLASYGWGGEKKQRTPESPGRWCSHGGGGRGGGGVVEEEVVVQIEETVFGSLMVGKELLERWLTMVRSVE